MRHVLIMGSSGSGKTYTAQYLRTQGINAIDLDTLTEFASYVDFDGNRVTCPVDADQEWMENHQFLWDRTYLERYLAEQTEDLYAFGMAGNAWDVLDCFDAVYCLKANPDLLAERLRDPSRENPMGNTDFQLKNAIEWGMQVQSRAEKEGITMIDATLSPQEIFTIIKA